MGDGGVTCCTLATGSGAEEVALPDLLQEPGAAGGPDAVVGVADLVVSVSSTKPMQ